MALENILILAAASLLWAATFRNHGRTWFMLIASVVVIFWLQPALPIRGADFFTPIATLVLVVLTWFITADDETRKQRKSIITHIRVHTHSWVTIKKDHPRLRFIASLRLTYSALPAV